MLKKKIKYNPLKAPKPREWLAIDEARRISLVEAYHVKEGIEVPNRTAHATFHVIVENQAALKEETPVAEAIMRLRGEGLNRHEAVHAVASIMSKYFYELFAEDKHKSGAIEEAYFAEVRGLTRQKWYDEFG